VREGSIALSFGSFYFTPDVSEPTELTRTDFFEGVRRCLGGIEGVSSVSVDSSSPLGDGSETITFMPIVTDDEQSYLGPHWGFGDITFDLWVPLSEQRDLDRLSRFTAETETFRVRLSFGWQVPVSCVEILDASAQDPTGDMRVVYLYLVKQVARSAEKLAFRCITPIFTHADFYVHPSDQEGPADAAFWLQAYSRPAYHRYDYFYNPAKIDEPVDEFFFEMQSEIDLYYSTSNDTREESIAWQSVATSVDRLTEEETPWQRRNPLGALHRGTRIREASIALATFAASRQLSSSQLERQRRSTYGGGATYFARELVESELDDRPDYPIEQFSQLVQMFEAGRVAELQLLVALVASIIGAAIGAGATLLAAG
jgi:hypothetical protein